MSSANVTVTGTAGPGLSVTAQEFTGVTSFTVDVVNGILVLNGIAPGPKEFDISDATTMTVTISGGVYTVAIS